jgi:hypothetical protein
VEELSKERDEAMRKCKEATKLAYAEVREQVPTLYLLTYAHVCSRMLVGEKRLCAHTLLTLYSGSIEALSRLYLGRLRLYLGSIKALLRIKAVLCGGAGGEGGEDEGERGVAARGGVEREPR